MALELGADDEPRFACSPCTTNGFPRAQLERRDTRRHAFTDQVILPGLQTTADICGTPQTLSACAVGLLPYALLCSLEYSEGAHSCTYL
jgi:hypothetical protein